MTKPKRVRPTSWPAWVAVDRVTGRWLCGSVDAGMKKAEGRTARQACIQYMKAYGDPVLHRATLTLSPKPKRKPKRKRR